MRKILNQNQNKWPRVAACNFRPEEFNIHQNYLITLGSPDSLVRVLSRKGGRYRVTQCASIDDFFPLEVLLVATESRSSP